MGLGQLFEEHFGVAPAAIVSLAGDGSNRSYRRLLAADGRRAVGVVGPDHEENRAFVSYTRRFFDAGLPVPEMFAENEDAGLYLIEDLGDMTLFDTLEAARTAGEGQRFPTTMLDLYEEVVRTLPRFQVEGHQVVDYSVAYPHAEFDRQSIVWDLNYFKYHFLKLAHVPFNESRLETDFVRLTDLLLSADHDFFLYRDFQSRNVMVTTEGTRYIDYQGGRRGAAQYDIASLLYDAKADVPPDVRDRLLATYLDALESYRAVDRDAFVGLYRGFVVVRILQALGAYGYRGFFERKPRFLRSVPFAARNIAGLLEEGLPVAMPELRAVFERIAETWGGSNVDPETEAELNVHIRSFSYRRGYPEDRSGHGGGHVFDCRAIPNPGREPEFRALSGLDASVKSYLAALPEAGDFLEHVTGLCRAQVEEYRRRSFDHFSISFGCTGGQHRSVYFAEEVAKRLRAEFPDIGVRVEHRERQMWPSSPIPAGVSAEG